MMKLPMEPAVWPPTRQEVANMLDVLEKLRRKGSIYFVRPLSKTSIPDPNNKKSTKLALPGDFIRENCDRIEEWVILRAHSCSGRSSRPWAVRLDIQGSLESPKVRFGSGLYAFLEGNDLRTEDSLVFVLNEDAPSEFVVHMFCGLRRYLPDESDRASTDDDDDDDDDEGAGEGGDYSRRFRFRARAHRKVDEHLKKARIRNAKHAKPTPLRRAAHLKHPGMIPCFRKVLSASNIGRSDRDPGSNSGQFEFPKRFIRSHGHQVGRSVKLQGIHEHSMTYIVGCQPRPWDNSRVDFRCTGWNRFVTENGLRKGHKLEFILMADSYFLVRKV